MEDIEAAPLSQITVWHSFLLILTNHCPWPAIVANCTEELIKITWQYSALLSLKIVLKFLGLTTSNISESIFDYDDDYLSISVQCHNYILFASYHFGGSVGCKPYINVSVKRGAFFISLKISLKDLYMHLYPQPLMQLGVCGICHRWLLGTWRSLQLLLLFFLLKH